MLKACLAVILLAHSGAASAAEPTPLQQQGVQVAKKLLVETIQKQRDVCRKTAEEVCGFDRLDVLEEVLGRWEDTLAYGRYALGVMEWQGKLSMAIADMADKYALQHGGHLDAGFNIELRHRIASDPAFQPPIEFAFRHLGLGKPQ